MQTNPDLVEGGQRLKVRRNCKPLLTLLTVAFNDAPALKQTIESVVARLSNDIEFVIIDGGSADATVELLQRFDGVIDYWRSEGDTGIYNAMNKGIGLATGTFVLHINAGDILLDVPLERLRQLGGGVSCAAGRVLLSNGKTFIPDFGVGLRVRNTLHHQGCFYRRTERFKYDESYRTFADFDLNQKLLKGRDLVVLLPEIIASHNLDGASNDRGRFSEVYEIVHKNFGAPWVVLARLYFKGKGLQKRLQKLC